MREKNGERKRAPHEKGGREEQVRKREKREREKGKSLELY